MRKADQPRETSLPVVTPSGSRKLTAREFQVLADVPPEAEWFANINNEGTKRIYATSLREFMAFVGISKAEDFRIVTRAHVIAWRKQLEERALSGATVRGKLAALSSLFEHLCDVNAVTHNPVKGVKRPKVETYEGKTPALGDHQARALLDAPSEVSTFGRFTPFTGLWVTAFTSHRCSNKEDSAASLPRTVAPDSARSSSCLRQAITCARVTIRKSSALEIPTKAMNSRRAVA